MRSEYTTGQIVVIDGGMLLVYHLTCQRSLLVTHIRYRQSINNENRREERNRTSNELTPLYLASAS